MAIIPTYADVNGHRAAYSSIELGIAGAPLITGARSINYGGDLEIGKIYGTNPKPIARTRGRVSFDGSLELYQKDWRNLLPILTQGGLYGFSELAFPVTVTYAEEASPLDIVIDELVGVRFGEPRDAHAEGGADGLFVTVPLDILDVIRNGFQGLRTFL